LTFIDLLFIPKRKRDKSMVDQQSVALRDLALQKAQYAATINDLNRAIANADLSDASTAEIAKAEIFAGVRALRTFFEELGIPLDEEHRTAKYLRRDNPYIIKPEIVEPKPALVPEDFLTLWEKKYQSFIREKPEPVRAGCVKPLFVFVKPNPDNAQILLGSGKGWKNHPIVDKRTPLVRALRDIGFEIDDRNIYEGGPPPAGSIRTEPYYIIEVTKDGVEIAQIAFCNQIGAATMVKLAPWLAEKQWESAPDVLQEQLGAKPFPYDEQGNWLQSLCAYITTDQQTPPIDENAPQLAPKVTKKFTLEQITEWIWLWIEHDIADGGLGDAPSAKSGDIWIKNDQGEWVPEGRTWLGVAAYLNRYGLPSLATLKNTLGIDNTMSMAEIQRRFLLAVQHSTNNTAPSQNSGPVMYIDKQGNWVPPKEKKQNWNSVTLWLLYNKKIGFSVLKEGLVDAGLLLKIDRKGRTKHYELTYLGKEYLDLQDTTGQLTVELFLTKRASTQQIAVDPTTPTVDLELFELAALEKTR
jgi:hypothetical protein